MNTDSLQQLTKAYGLTQRHFTLLNLGFFFEDIARRANLSRLAREVAVRTPDGNLYKLPPHVASDFLQQMYDLPSEPTLMSHLVFVASLRAITMSIVTAVDSTVVDGTSEIAAAYEADVFAGDGAVTDSFLGIARFLRNVLSHNIEDRLNVQSADFEALKNYRNSKANKFSPRMLFKYDYSDAASTIHIPGYAPNFSIVLDLNTVHVGQILDDVLPTYQALLFLEFCYNSLFMLNRKYGTSTAS
ncbi:MAG: hypothetical protein QY332_01905 [Anaerolineales bacterium]|nr:MAG: hypothetical protein QY332_01905 [Anaerolineales bacterium]